MSAERRHIPGGPAAERRLVPERRDRMRRINTIHFVGIGGSGMSGIAAVLLNLGYREPFLFALCHARSVSASFCRSRAAWSPC
jgi:hypothetical protein